MPFLVRKLLKGKTYLYLRHNHRVNGKVKTAWQIYLGPEEEFHLHSKIAKREIKTETIEFGLIAALFQVAKRIKLIEVIDAVSPKRNQGLSVGEHLVIAALNRCVQPTTKTQLQSWIDKTIIRKLFPNITENLDSRAYWNHFRYLNDEKIEKIEKELIKNIQSEFNIDMSQLSFDPTNFYSYINPKKENQTIPKHGHSKEGRKTLNIINLSLFCTLDGGIPLFHLLYPGNIQDAVHFKEQALPALKRKLSSLNLSSSEITLIFDKGNLSNEAFEQIDEQRFRYICSDRPSTHKKHLSLDPDQFQMSILPNGKEIGTSIISGKKYGKKRHFIAVYSPKKAEWQFKNFLKKVERKKQEIKDYFQTRLNFAPNESKQGKSGMWRIKTNVDKKILSMICRKKFQNVLKYSISGPDSISKEEGGTFKLYLSIDPLTLAETKNTMGKSFLMSNVEEFAPEKIVWVYRQQYLVEQAFKWLKNSDFLQIRPMYHSVDSSIRGHVFVCYLGLVLLSLLVRNLIDLGVPSSIYEAIATLNEIRITRIILTGKRNPIENLNQLSPKADLLYSKLKLNQFF